MTSGTLTPRSGLRVQWYGVSFILTLATVTASFLAAYLTHGHLFRTVNMVELRRFGGVTFEDVRSFELWRIPVAQLLHAKMPHMLLNAGSLLLVGGLLEARLGGARTFLIWLVAGGIATVVSPILIEPPWNVGTGASQANFALAGCASVLALRSPTDRPLARSLVILVVVPGLALDLLFAGYLKPGHLVGYLLGLLFGWAYIERQVGRC